MFYVVQLDSDIFKEKIVVPSIWLDKYDTLCLLPPITDVAYVETLAQGQSTPKHGWQMHSVSFKQSFDTYSQAKANITKGKPVIVDLEEEEEEEKQHHKEIRGKRKRKLPRFLEQYSMESDDDDKESCGSTQDCSMENNAVLVPLTVKIETMEDYNVPDSHRQPALNTTHNESSSSVDFSLQHDSQFQINKRLQKGSSLSTTSLGIAPDLSSESVTNMKSSNCCVLEKRIKTLEQKIVSLKKILMENNQTTKRILTFVNEMEQQDILQRFKDFQRQKMTKELAPFIEKLKDNEILSEVMAEKLFFKIWSAAGEKKAIVVQTFQELLEKGAQKLNIQGNIKVFMQDGTEIDDDDVLRAVEKNTVLFLLSEGDPKPWLNVTENKLLSPVEVPVDDVPVFSPQNETESTSVLKKGIKLLPWPAAFPIPKGKFSTDLKNHIDNGELVWSTKSELLGHLSNEIRKYTFMPTAKQRHIVARALISEFPSLKSNIGEGHEGWSLKIYDKVREDIRKNKDIVHTTKRKICTGKLLLTPKRQRNLSLEYIPSQVNTGTFQFYLSMMDNEMNKIPSSRDKIMLATALEATFSDRRALVNTNIMLSDLFSKYPALFTAEGINQDFTRMKNCDLSQMIFQGLNVCSTAIIEFAEKKRKKNQIIENLLTHFMTVQNDHITKIILATALIPNIFGESSDFLYKEYDIGCSIDQLLTGPVTPHVAVIGNVFNATEVYVVAEKSIMIQCNGFLEAISAAIGMYFVCNIECPKQAATTYLFFESYILKLMPKTIPTKLITFCNTLPKI